MIKTCKRCGKEFEQERGAQRYCNECRKLSKDLLSGKIFDNSKPQVCAYCGKTFYYKRKRKYCCEECANESLPPRIYKAKTYQHECSVCGKVYTNSSLNSDKCTDCLDAWQRERLVVFNKDISNRATEERTCLWCGKKYNAINLINQKFCSRRCSNAYHSKIKRARKQNAFIEAVSFDEIYKRDRGICQLCGGKVSLDYSIYHPQSASLDHIIPLSRGGTHEAANVQLAHLYCNMSKGSKVMAQ